MLTAPWWLLLGALNLVVLALHARRRRTVTVPSTFLWRRLERSATPQHRWHLPVPNLLLLLQLLFVSLVALALAGPVWNSARGDDEHRVYVLDASGSMRAGEPESRFAAARSYLVRQVEDEGGSPSRLSIVVAGPRPEVAAARLDAGSRIVERLGSVEATDGPADWRRVRELLHGLVREGEATRVTLVTDGAGSDPSPMLREALPNATVDVVPFGAAAPNVGIVDADVALIDGEARRWQASGSVRASGEGTTTVDVRVFFEPAAGEGFLAWGEERATLEDGVAAFDLDLQLPGPGTLEIRLPDDGSPHDNTAAFLVNGGERTGRVLHVGPDNPALLAALRAVGGVEVFQADALPEDDARYDLVVLDGVTVTRVPHTHSLWLGDAHLAAEGAPPPLPDPTPTGWRSDHPLAASVDWGNLTVGAAYRLPRRPGAEVLLEASGSPLIQTRATEHGHEVTVAFPLDRSNWQTEASFPAFVASLLHRAVPGLGEGAEPPCRVGRACSLDPRLLRDGLRLIAPSGTTLALPSPFVADPAGLRGRWAPPGFDGLFLPERVGVYRRAGEGTAGAPLLAVNGLFEEEVDLAPAAGAPEGSARRAVATPVPLRTWLLLVALVLLLVETWLAGRGPHRFLRRSSLQSGHPLAAQRRAVLALRVLALSLVLLALLDVPVLGPSRNQEVVVIRDAGPHPAAAEERLARFAGRVGDAADAGREVGVVQLGAPSHVARDLGMPVEGAAGALGVPAADLEGALELGVGMLPADERGRIIVAATGMETRGSVSTAIPELVARGIPVDVLPLPSIGPGEVIAGAPEVPERIVAGDRFPIRSGIYSERSTHATVRFLRDGEPFAEQEVDLRPGRNVVETIAQEDEPGRYLYEFTVSSEDEVRANDRSGTVVRVEPAAKVVVFTPQPTAGEALANALELQGASVEVLAPNEAPWYLKDWLAYDVVILMNVPSIDLHTRQQEMLAEAVHDHGTGLVLLGGENSFGPGGYYQTPLERLSPLSSRVPREGPEAALLFVLDRSGSMQQIVGEVSRLEIAKEATLNAVQLLHERSQVGVVVFDSEATVLVPMQSAANSGAIAAAVEPLQPGGGTSIYPALVEAHELLRNSEASARHVVLMTDGLSQPGDFQGILELMREDDITVSAVAIGEGADVERIEVIARHGRGAFHATRDFRALPSILSQEALLLSSTPVEEGVATPHWVDRTAPFLTGLPRELPPLHGYVITTEKPSADIHLSVSREGEEDAPLLASWRYGTGKVVAFASHGAGAWTREWLAMPEYPLLWGQVVRHLLPEVPRPGLHVALERRGDEVVVSLRVVDETGSLARDVAPRATLLSVAAEEPTPLALSETAPGLHQATFSATDAGRYSVQAEVGEQRAQADLFVAYPARLDPTYSDADRLQALAALTGGRVLLGDEPVFPGGAWRWTAVPGWRIWLVVATALLLADLILRYAPRLLSRPGAEQDRRRHAKVARRT